MGFRLAIFLQQLPPSESGVHCFQSPCSSSGTVCCAALDHGVSDAGAKEVMSPTEGPCLQEWAANHVGSKPLVHPVSAWPHECSYHAGSRARGQNIEILKAQRERACTKLQSERVLNPQTKRERLLHTKCTCKRKNLHLSAPLFLKGRPEIPGAQEANGYQAFPTVFNVCHFLSAPQCL